MGPAAVDLVMNELQEPLWRLVASQYQGVTDHTMNRHIAVVLASPGVQSQRALLEARSLRIDPTPVLWKELPGRRLRFFFRVVGDRPTVEEGMIVALVLLYDLDAERTLYVHTVHAGPESNPLLKHLHGPMAEPKAQKGLNGELATLRLLEQKRAIWARFLEERGNLGEEEAGQRWRDRYFWSLVRLYHCERCSGCRWGAPQFEGPPGEPYRTVSSPPRPPARLPLGVDTELLEAVRQGEWLRTEAAYAQRGGFEVNVEPRLAARLSDGIVVVAFATDTEFLEAGALVGLISYVHEASREVRYAQVLSAGPEPEALFLHSERVFGLPPPQRESAGERARAEYIRWRREAWSRFWLDELEEGLSSASQTWLCGYWEALAYLFGVRTPLAPHAASCSKNKTSALIPPR